MSKEAVDGAPPPPPSGRNLQNAELSEVQKVLDDVLSQQWKRAIEGGKAGSVKHVVGGFSVVVRLPDQGVAYRLQPMKNMKAGLTWVAFYSMLFEAAKDPGAVQVPRAPRLPAALRARAYSRTFLHSGTADAPARARAPRRLGRRTPCISRTARSCSGARPRPARTGRRYQSPGTARPARLDGPRAPAAAPAVDPTGAAAERSARWSAGTSKAAGSGRRRASWRSTGGSCCTKGRRCSARGGALRKATAKSSRHAPRAALPHAPRRALRCPVLPCAGRPPAGPAPRRCCARSRRADLPRRCGQAEDGGRLGGPAVLNGIMFPTHWFWTKVGRPSGQAAVKVSPFPPHRRIPREGR
jgi:hypothetical protein